MQFSSPNTNFLTQGGATLDPCQGLCLWTHIGALYGDPTCGFLRFAPDVSPSKQFLKVGSPVILCPVCFLAFHYLVLRMFVLFYFVHRTMWKTHVHLIPMTHGCRRYVFFCFVFCFVFCIAAHNIPLARFNSCVINIHFVKLYEAIIFYYDSLWYRFIPLRGYCTPGPYFWRLCAFSQKIKQLRTKYPMDLVRNVQKNSKITVLLQYKPLLWSYSEKCAKINIFHVLSHKSITTWVTEISVQ